MKRCFKCGVEKELDDFYKHPGMNDGHLNKCKECSRLDVRINREDKKEQYREYERQRYQEPNRNAYVKAKHKEHCKHNPERTTARYAVSNAIRDGRIIRLPCEICGEEKVEAHHNDYSKPLEVHWFCKRHHWEHHRNHG